MLHLLKSKVFIRAGAGGGSRGGEQGRGGTRPPLSEFSGSAPEWQSVILVSMKHAVSKTIFIYKELTVLDDKSYGDTSDVFMTTGLTKAK